ncbi:hypothetical protein SGRI78S_02605 [Streptomyces griseus subsp. griseus]
MAVLGARAPGADLGQARVALDLDAPALVVGEVEVEDVQLVRGQQVQVAQDVFLGQEVPRDVEHHAAPAEAGLVLDDDRRDLPGAARGEGSAPEGVRAEELPERLRAPEDAGRGAAGDAHGGRPDLQAVRLRGERLVQGQHDALPVRAGSRAVARARAGAVARGQGQSGGRAERGAQPAGDALGSRARRQRGGVAERVGPGGGGRQGARGRDQTEGRGVHGARGDGVRGCHDVSPLPLRPVRRRGVAVRVRRRPVRGWSSPSRLP